MTTLERMQSLVFQEELECAYISGGSFRIIAGYEATKPLIEKIIKGSLLRLTDIHRDMKYYPIEWIEAARHVRHIRRKP